MDRKIKGSYEILITKDTIGRVLSDCVGYKTVSKVDSIIDYGLVDVPENSTFKVVGFNLYNKRVSVILYIKGNTKNSIVIEMDYNILVNNCMLENTNIFKGVEALLITCKERSVIDTKVIRDTLMYLAFGAIMFLLGKI